MATCVFKRITSLKLPSTSMYVGQGRIFFPTSHSMRKAGAPESPEYFQSRRSDSSFYILFFLIPNISHGRVEVFGRLAAKDRNDVKFWLVGCVCPFFLFCVLAWRCPNLIEYHHFERIKCEIESERRNFFYFRSTSTIRFYFAWVFLRVPDFFVILKAGLRVRRKHKRKPRFPFSRACAYVCVLRRTFKPAFNYPSLYVLDFSLELENE